MLDIYTYSIKVTWLIDRITVIRIEGLELGSNETLTWKETGSYIFFLQLSCICSLPVALSLKCSYFDGEYVIIKKVNFI